MKIIVAGSRDITNANLVWIELDKMRYYIAAVFTGDCRGPDSFARQWCVKRGISGYRCFKADWEKHGKKAGPIRNQEMIDAGATHLLAFHKNKSKGTQDIINRAIKAGIWIRVINCD